MQGHHEKKKKRDMWELWKGKKKRGESGNKCITTSHASHAAKRKQEREAMSPDNPHYAMRQGGTRK